MTDERRIESMWAHVHGLAVLAATGSYTAAAQRLGLSKAAMSQRISELERAAGVPLVRRTTRSVGLTEAGQQLVEATRGAFEQIGQAFAGVRDLAEQPSGLLRVTAPVALGRQQIVPRLPAFLRAHPQLRIELDLSDRLASLATEGFDLAVRHAATPPDTHVAWTLCETRSVLVATRAYLRRRGEPATPEELASHDCLHYPRAGATPVWRLTPEPVARSERARAAASAAPVNVAIGGCFAANNSEALREAALAGLGIALLPDFSAQQALRSGKLVRVLPQWQPAGPFASQLYAIRPYSAHVPRAVQALVAWLRESLAEGFAA